MNILNIKVFFNYQFNEEKKEVYCTVMYIYIYIFVVVFLNDSYFTIF